MKNLVTRIKELLTKVKVIPNEEVIPSKPNKGIVGGRITQLPPPPFGLELVGRILSWLKEPYRRLPVSCTVFVVDDTMEETAHSIEQSWLFTSYALRMAAGVSIHLSNLRPKGIANKYGLVSSGPTSFAQIYSKFNEILRRGGTYKGGAVVVHLDADHPDAVEFATASRQDLPWVKRTINVGPDFLEHPQLDVFLRAAAAGDIFFVKKQYDNKGERIYHNVCVSGETTVLTTDGCYKVKDLVGRQFTAVLSEGEFPSTPQGFWSNGFKYVYKVTATCSEGYNYSLEATPDHLLQLSDLSWKAVAELNSNDELKLSNEEGSARVIKVQYSFLKEVYDCSIPGINKFDANGLVAHNCLEVLLPSNGTCNLSHINLGALHPEEIPKAMAEGMTWLCELHAQTGVGESGYYLPPEQDKQVGLGMLGLANLLAIEGVTYAELVDALEYVLGLNELSVHVLAPKALLIAMNLREGYKQAAEVAKFYGMERAFVIAPTANCSFNAKDRQGNTTSPEIAPPVSAYVERESETTKVIYADYHPNTEIAIEVGFDVHFRLNDAWQQMMDETGLAHAISMNWWSDTVVMDRALIKRWMDSSLKSLYYAWRVLPDTQDKSQVATAETYQYPTSQSEATESPTLCPLNPTEGECSQCAE